MKVITLSNQKGGVAKTTTSASLSSGLARKGYRVLAVDLDPQSNFCLTAGLDPLEIDQSLFDVFKKTAAVTDVIRQSPVGYDFLPSGLTLAGADMDFTQKGREFMLSEALEEISDKYDYAIIDTPPTLGILTVNALTASQYVIVPMLADAYSLQGLSQLHGLIQSVRKKSNPDLQIMGLLLTRFNGRQSGSKAAAQMIQRAAEQIGTKVFNVKVRESVAVRDAALIQSDFMTEAPKANATLDYNKLVEEVISYGN